MLLLQPDDVETRMFKASANRAMGDINDAGDALFGGEVQLEAKVCIFNKCLILS